MAASLSKCTKAITDEPGTARRHYHHPEHRRGGPCSQASDIDQVPAAIRGQLSLSLESLQHLMKPIPGDPISTQVDRGKNPHGPHRGGVNRSQLKQDVGG